MVLVCGGDVAVVTLVMVLVGICLAATHDVQLTELKEKLEAVDEKLKHADYKARPEVTHTKTRRTSASCTS